MTDKLKVGYVIGNGLSRKDFDLHKLDGCVTVGCNYLYKDYSPTYLVAIDRHVENSPVFAIEKLVAKNGTKKNPRKWKFVTQIYNEKWWWMAVEGVPVICEQFLNNGFCHNSGMYGALLLSQVQKFDIVYLIGMDFFRPVEGGINDIYGGSYESHPGFVKVWNHMFSGAPLKKLAGTVDKEGQPEFTVSNLIETKFVRVGPIADSDREYYKTEHPLLECIDSFDDMPIVCTDL